MCSAQLLYHLAISHIALAASYLCGFLPLKATCKQPVSRHIAGQTPLNSSLKAFGSHKQFGSSSFLHLLDTFSSSTTNFVLSYRECDSSLLVEVSLKLYTEVLNSNMTDFKRKGADGDGTAPAMQAHTMKVADVARELNTNLDDGLRASEAKARVEQYGKNELDDGPGVQPLKILVHQIANGMILVMRTTLPFCLTSTLI